MNGIAEICDCGHAKESHFHDQQRPGEHPPGTTPQRFWGACLGFRCDECKRFRQRKVPE